MTLLCTFSVVPESGRCHDSMVISKQSPRNGFVTTVLQCGNAFQALSSTFKALAGAMAWIRRGSLLWSHVSIHKVALPGDMINFVSILTNAHYWIFIRAILKHLHGRLTICDLLTCMHNGVKLTDLILHVIRFTMGLDCLIDGQGHRNTTKEKHQNTRAGSFTIL